MSRSSRRIEVTRHDTSCAVLRGRGCTCSPVSSVESYVRVCARCGGDLPNRRRPFCSRECRQDSRMQAKSRDGVESDRQRMIGADP